MRKEISLILIVCVLGVAAQYELKETWDSSNFFTKFDFFSGDDPTHGILCQFISLFYLYLRNYYL